MFLIPSSQFKISKTNAENDEQKVFQTCIQLFRAYSAQTPQSLMLIDLNFAKKL